ncbi:MAG: hypothetical protein IPP83_18350 [Flavobacteriales bacterium]|nr:hypothetical protein [Flavobacteriales bacterium]
MSFTKGERIALIGMLWLLSILVVVLVARHQIGGSYAPGGEQGEQDPWWMIPEWWAVMVNIPIAAATVFLWFITQDTLKQTKRSVDLSVSQERPYLVVDKVTLNAHQHDPRVAVNALFKNHGRSLLILVGHEYGISLVPKGKKPARPLRSIITRRDVLYVPMSAGGQHTISLAVFDSGDQYAVLRKVDPVDFCYVGWLTYRDTGGNRFRHYFTAVLRKTTTATNGWPVGAFDILTDEGYWGDDQVGG